jgi:3-hydroxy-9,10-secoandrosta-1,3,5(10)-triene-9,17-dione monooxygenase
MTYPTVESPASSIPSGHTGDEARAQFVARAVALLPLLRECAEIGESDRRVPEKVIDALAGAGLLRLLTPKRFNGHETDLRTLTEVAETLGEADGSAAWVAMIIAVTNWLASLFPEQAQEDVFGVDPDARVTGVAAPTGMAHEVEGGWRISGRWGYNSGAWHATWAALGALQMNGAGEVVGQAMVLVPVSELTVEDTWFTAGMRATGSNTLVAEDLFVPSYRVLSVPAASEGEYPTPYTQEALYRSAFGPMLVLCLAGPLLGLGRAALDWTVAQAATKQLSFTIYARQADSVGFQTQVAEAALKIETAQLHIYRAVDQVDLAARQGARLGYDARARIRAEAGYAMQQVLEAVNTLLNAHGAAGFAESSPFQRIWRDANTAARHAGLVPAVGYEVYGKTLLGNEERPSVMV